MTNARSELERIESRVTARLSCFSGHIPELPAWTWWRHRSQPVTLPGRVPHAWLPSRYSERAGQGRARLGLVWQGGARRGQARQGHHRHKEGSWTSPSPSKAPHRYSCTTRG